MNVQVEEQPGWWQRTWARPGVRGIAIMLASVVAFGVLAWALGMAARWLLPLPPVKFDAMTAEPGAPLYLRAIRSIVVVAAAYWLVVRLVQRRKVNELAPSRFALNMATGLGVGVAIMVLVSLAMAAAGVLHWEGGVNGSAPLLAPFFVLGLVPGITEEIIARGVLLEFVERGLGTWVALLVSSALFGLGHIGNPNATLWSSIAIALEAGLLLGMAYVWTRSLWFVMGLHIAWNFTQGPLLGIPVSGLDVHGLLQARTSGPELLSGGAFGAEASVFTVVLCVVISLWFTKKAIAAGRIVRPSWSRPAD